MSADHRDIFSEYLCKLNPTPILRRMIAAYIIICLYSSYPSIRCDHSATLVLATLLYLPLALQILPHK